MNKKLLSIVISLILLVTSMFGSTTVSARDEKPIRTKARITSDNVPEVIGYDNALKAGHTSRVYEKRNRS